MADLENKLHDETELEENDSSAEFEDGAEEQEESQEGQEGQAEQAPRRRRKKRTLFLKNFLESEEIPKNEKGQFVPNNNQLKKLVNCIDESTNQLISLAKIDTSEITSMQGLFKRSERQDYSGIKEWDTSKVESFYETFYASQTFNEDISNWDVSNCKSFVRMFERTQAFDQPIGAKWNTKSATQMWAMFCGAWVFNNGGQPFGENWKTDLVENMSWMFGWANSFNAEGLNNWNVSKVKHLNRMFTYTGAFNQPLDKWDLSSCEALNHMFYKAQSFNQDLSTWGDKLGKVRNMGSMFKDAKSLTQNFLSKWKIPSGCNTRGMTTRSGLEGRATRTVEALPDFFVSELKENEIQKSEYRKFEKNENFLPNWLPFNIRESFQVYLAKYDENGTLTAANEKNWRFAFCEIFEQNFLLERIGKDDERLDEKWLNREEDVSEFSIWQGRDPKAFEDFEENRAGDYADDNLDIFLSTQDIWIVNKAKFDMSETILSIVTSMLLVKAFKRKMRVLDEEAKRYKTPKDLEISYKKLCQFDLHAYQNTPFVQNKLSDQLLLKVWRAMSKEYLVAEIHEELAQTISQIAQQVNNEKQNQMSWIMLLVAIFSAIAAILAAVPVVQMWF